VGELVDRKAHPKRFNAKAQRRKGLFESVDDPADSIFQVPLAEIQEQAQTEPRYAEIGQQLCHEHRGYLSYGLALHDDQIIDQQVDTQG